MKEKFSESNTGKRLSKYIFECDNVNKKLFGFSLTEDGLKQSTLLDLLTKLIPNEIRADKAIDTGNTEDLNNQPLIKDYEIFLPFSMEDYENSTLDSGNPTLDLGNFPVYMIVQYGVDTPKE